MELWTFKMALQRKIKHKWNPNDGKKFFFNFQIYSQIRMRTDSVTAKFYNKIKFL